MAAIVIKRQRVCQSAAREDEALLFREVGDLVNEAQRLGMRAAGQEACFEKLSRLARCDRPVADAAGSRFHLNERFEPKEAARSSAHKLNVEATAARLVAYCVCDKVRANGERRESADMKTRTLIASCLERPRRSRRSDRGRAGRSAPRQAKRRGKARNCQGNKRFQRGGWNGARRPP